MQWQTKLDRSKRHWVWTKRSKCEGGFVPSIWLLPWLDSLSWNFRVYVDGNTMPNISWLPTLRDWMQSIDRELWWRNPDVSCHAMVWRIQRYLPLMLVFSNERYIFWFNERCKIWQCYGIKQTIFRVENILFIWLSLFYIL